MTFIVIGVALFVVVVLMKWIQIVPQKQVKIIERLGKYHGVWRDVLLLERRSGRIT